MASSVRRLLATKAYRPPGLSRRRTMPHSGARPYLLVCDVQEAFSPHIHRAPHVEHTCRLMVRAAAALGWPVAVTEQVPEKLGRTVPAVLRELPPGASVEPKTSFSMVGNFDVPEDATHAVVVGIETHVCVQQTVLDLLADDKCYVVVLADGVSSQREGDRSASLQLMRDAGAVVTTAGAVLRNVVDGADGLPAAAEVRRLAAEAADELPPDLLRC